MKKIILTLSATAALSFTSCQKELEVNTTFQNEVSFSASAIKTVTKASGSDWDTNDAIGITMSDSQSQTTLSNNIEYTTSDSGESVNFTVKNTDEAIYYPNYSKEVDFWAYYPYQESWDVESDMVFDIAEPQNGGNQPLADLMISETLTNRTSKSGDQVFEFSHVLSMIEIEVSNYDGFGGTVIDNLSEVTASISGVNSLYTLNDKSCDTESTTTITMMKEAQEDGKLKFSVILLPCETSGTLVFAYNDITYSTTVSKTLEAGNQYNYTAVVGEPYDSNISLVFEGITDWVNNEISPSVSLEYVDGYYQIYDRNGLNLFNQIVNGGEISANARLMNDINLNGSADNQWSPLTYRSTGASSGVSYSGTFDGCGYEISGLYIYNSDGESCQALFSTTYGATIKNLTIDGYVDGNNTTAGTSTITCLYVGAFVGYAISTTIINCHNKATVNGDKRVGGIVGTAYYSSIINCYNTGDVTAIYTNDYGAGGIVGLFSNNGVINNCYNTGYITGRQPGGIASYLASSCYITSCFNNSDKVSSAIYTNYSTTSDYTDLTDDEMKALSFSESLNTGAYNYNIALPSNLACAWIGVEGEYPTLDFNTTPTVTE